MTRPKGTPKTGGRKKGTPNKVSPTLRKRYQEYMETNYDKFIAAMDDLYKESPKDFVKAWNDMSNKVIPTLQSVSGELEVQEKRITIADKLKELAEAANPF